jgi:hypothetical protein
MADETIPKLGEEVFPNAAKNNADVAAKLAAQDISGKSTSPVDNLEVGSALDALAKQAEEDAKKKAEGIVEPAAKSAEELAKEAEVKAAADKEAAELAEQAKKADELFKNDPQLPANASPKSGEAFSAIKIKAAKEIAARESELEKLRADKAQLEERLKNQAPPEALKELEDHRQWRAKLDIEADPKFKSFDKEIAGTHEFIYAQLKKSPVVTDEVIAEIKKYGGPENVAMEKIFSAVKDPTLQRIVENKISDIEQIKYNKVQAVEAAKKNVSEYIAERQKASEASITGHNVATEKHFSGLVGAMPWYSEKTAPEKATEAEKKEVSEHNAFVVETKKQLSAAMKDDSPEMRAIMLAGMGQLFHLQTVHKNSEAAHAAKEAKLEQNLKEVTEKYDKLRNGSVTRLRESNAPKDGKTEVAKPADQFHMTAGESLDNLRKQVTEERERAAAGK